MPTAPAAAVRAYLDTETTSRRRLDRQVWNVGIVRVDPDGTVTEREWIVDDVDLTGSDAGSLMIGQFWHRHPRYGGNAGDAEVLSAGEVAAAVEEQLRPVRTDPAGDCLDYAPVPVFGIVPEFDVHSLWMMLEQHGLPWAAHFHPIDTDAVAVGYLAATIAHQLPLDAGDQLDPAVLPSLLPPWNRHDLGALLGVERPSAAERHTALGDARWAKRFWDRMVGPTGVPVAPPRLVGQLIGTGR